MSNTHSPPVRRSIRRVLQEKPSGPHHCGSVSELNQPHQPAETGGLILRFRIIERDKIGQVRQPDAKAEAIPIGHILSY